jgi:O-methyltransferase involved in polyketide biosynthesis
VLDGAWLDAVSAYRGRPFLFLAEGVLMYFTEAQVRWLVLTLRDHFPGAELVFDAFSPLFSWANNLRVKRTGVGARSQWALKHGRDLEAWGAASTSSTASTSGAGIRLLDEWFPYITPEPRLARARSIRHIPLLARVLGIFHYRLGTTPP